MSKPKYRLQPVLEIRVQARQAAARAAAGRREELAEAAAELVRRGDEVAACRARQAAAQEEMFDEAARGAEARRLVTHRAYLADLRHIERELSSRYEQQRAAVTLAEGELERAVATLLEAVKEVQVIESHHRSWRERTGREEGRRAQKLSDEVAALTRQHRRG